MKVTERITAQTKIIMAAAAITFLLSSLTLGLRFLGDFFFLGADFFVAICDNNRTKSQKLQTVAAEKKLWNPLVALTSRLNS